MFAFPSKKPLNSLLNKVPFGSDIIDVIFYTLASRTQECKDCDKIGALMFDEISIREHLPYNHSADWIVGVKDLRAFGRTSKIANHAMVLLVNGLFKKMKAAHCLLFFSNGAMFSILLSDIIRLILHKCFEVGLRALTTIWDVGLNYRKRIGALGLYKKDP